MLIRVIDRRLLLATLVVMVACGAGERPENAARFSVRDSSGVRIASHEPDASVDTVPLAPVLTIGSAGDPDYEFFRVRQVSVLGSGNIVVANGGTTELMFYGPDGAFIRRIGRRGEGPDELGFLTTVYTGAGDTLTILDPRRRRLVHFDSAGVFVDGESFAEDLTSEPPPGSCTFPGLMGVLADGTRLTRGWGCMEFLGRDGLRPSMTTFALARDERRDTLGRFNMNSVWERGDAEPGPGMFELVPFGAVMSWAVGGDRVFLSFGRESEVHVFDVRGQLTDIFREEAALLEVTAADRDLYRRQRVAEERPLPDDVPFPDQFAAYRRLILSHDGALWAQWTERPSDAGTRRWTVFSKSGASIRRLVLPDIQVHAVRNGRIYGMQEDSLGVQTVVVLEAPAG